MGKVWVKELTGGLDVRRSPETTPGGLLIKGLDGHINSGGEFEKRAAFVSAYTLPAGTVGLAADTASLIVFGSAVDPGVPAGVAYQRLQKAAKTLSDVPSFDLYGGDVYAVGEFSDGTIVHYLDTVEVTDWFDGRARTSFQVTGGSVTAAVAAAGSFDVTGGTLGGGNEITSVKIDGVDVLTGPIAHTGNNGTTASALVTAINSLTSNPNYAATLSGSTVNITASLTGTAANGKTIAIVVGGDATAGNIVHMQGGAAAVTSSIDDIKVNGVSIINAAVDWTTSHEATATAIAAAINGYASTPDYDATAVGDQVNIIADASGAGSNGYAVTITTADGLTVTPSSGIVLAGGVTSAAFTPGRFVKTVGRRMMALSGSIWHLSGIAEPTHWTTDYTGAAFFDQSKEAAGAEDLMALADYQGFVAIFAKKAILIWFVDPDPDLIAKRQVLSKTGTVSPSVAEFGDADVFYPARSGARSVRARDSSNNATTSDLGSPVDKLIKAKLAVMTADARLGVIGLINPVDDRFWLCFPDGEIFVFSFFPAAKVSAWTMYDTGFAIDNALVFGERVYLRSGNTIYVYGGLNEDEELTYDSTVAKCWLPYFDAAKPTESKNWQGMDAAVEGSWNLYAAMEPTALSTRELIATISETTYNKQRIPFEHACTHVSPQFESTGSTEAKVSAWVGHYEGGEDD